MSNSISNPEAVIAALRAYFISQAVMLALVLIVFPLEVWGLVEYILADKVKRANGYRFRRGDREMAYLRLLLFLNAICVVVLTCLMFAGSIITNVSAGMCDFLAKSYALVYLSGLAFAYLFLLQRVRMVSKFSQNYVFTTMLRVTTVVLYVAIFAFIILMSNIITGRTTYEGRCMQILPPWSAWFFMACNVVLSITLIYLFVAPLRSMVNNTGLSTAQRELKTIYRRNMMISLFTVVFTTVTVNVYGAFAYFAEDEQRDELNVYGLIVITWDSFVLATCCRRVSMFWLPKLVYNCGRSRSQQNNFQSAPPAQENDADDDNAVEAQCVQTL